MTSVANLVLVELGDFLREDFSDENDDSEEEVENSHNMMDDSFGMNSIPSMGKTNDPTDSSDLAVVQTDTSHQTLPL